MDKDEKQPEAGANPEEAVPSQELIAEVARVTDATQYPLAFRGELKDEWREAQLKAVEIERAAQIRAAAMADGADAAETASRSNIRAAAVAAVSIERQIASSLSIVNAMSETILGEAVGEGATLAQMDRIATLMNASASAAQVLGRLRDGYSRSVRHVILEDNRRRGRPQT
jgi:hypothetical protein